MATITARHRDWTPATQVAAVVVRNAAGSGATLISSGFPLPPGLATEDMVRAGRIRVYVQGSEVAACVTALRGRHADGSIRSILVQFTRSMAQGEQHAAVVEFGGGIRGYPDPAYVRPTRQVVADNNAILPTSPDYLCSTLLYGRRLLPAGRGTAAEEKLFTALAINQVGSQIAASDADLLKTPPVDSRRDSVAYYEPAAAVAGLWCRTGDVAYQREAVKQVLSILSYNTPTVATAGVEAAVINPDGRTEGINPSHGLPNEQHGPISFSYAIGYLLTGYRDFWGLVAFLANYNQASVTSRTVALSGASGIIRTFQYDSHRSHYSSRYGNMLSALMVDATIPVGASGMFGGRAMNFTNQLSWTLDAIAATAWDLKWIPYSGGSGTIPAFGGTVSQGGVTATLRGVGAQQYDPLLAAGSAMPATGYLQVNNIAGGSFAAGALSGISATATGPEIADYRQGMVGVHAATVRFTTNNADYLPIFQLTFTANFLIDYYLYFQRDARVPGMVKVLLDIILMNIRLMRPGDSQYGKVNATWGSPIWGKPYDCECPPNTTVDAPCYDLPEYPRLIAFVLRTSGEATVNGATYSQWYARTIDTANIAPPNVFSMVWKNVGQFYGFGQDTGWMNAQASLVDYGPAAMREPTAYAAIPGATPDVTRS